MLLAHKMAIASEYVTAEAIEANEFPELANQYEVYGVPRSIINDVVAVEGAVPEAMFIDSVMSVMDEAGLDDAAADAPDDAAAF